VAPRSWTAIGGKIPVGPEDAAMEGSTANSAEVTAFCSEPSWWANDIRLWFDARNTVHVVWCWSDYITSNDVHREYHVYAKSSDDGRTFTRSDGTAYKINLGSAELVLPTPDHYGGTSLTTNGSSNPLVAIQRHRAPFKITRFDSVTGKWTNPEGSPSGASVVINDGKGMLWAFAGGPAIYQAADQHPFAWNRVYQGQGWSDPKVFYAANEDAFYLRLMKCEKMIAPLGNQRTTDEKCTAKIARFQPRRS